MGLVDRDFGEAGGVERVGELLAVARTVAFTIAGRVARRSACEGELAAGGLRSAREESPDPTERGRLFLVWHDQQPSPRRDCRESPVRHCPCGNSACSGEPNWANRPTFGRSASAVSARELLSGHAGQWPRSR